MSESLWVWLTGPVGSPIVGLASLIVGLLGFPISLLGLWLTYGQASKAESAAKRAESAVQNFRVRMNYYSASRDIGEAIYAMDVAKSRIQNQGWDEGIESYETSMRALLRVVQSDALDGEPVRDELSKIIDNMRNFCDRVDRARIGKGRFPDITKAIPVMRRNHEVLSAVKTDIDRKVESNGRDS